MDFGGGGEEAVDAGDGVGGAYLAPGACDGEADREDAVFELLAQLAEPA